MSQATPIGRETPRWSVGGQNAPLPASTAGLPASSAIVLVGPPLFAIGASRGLVLLKLPAPRKLHVSSELRLCPPSVMGPDTLPPAKLFATMQFRRVTDPG